MSLEKKAKVSQELLNQIEEINPKAVKDYYKMQGKLGQYYVKKFLDCMFEGLDSISKSYIFH